MKTKTTTPKDIVRKWYVVDAKGQTLGRLASKIAKILQGKHKPYYAPYLDTGDYVIVINADKIKLTGRKWEQKTYFRHSGYLGGEKIISFRKMMEKQPEFPVINAVRGMLPKNKLGRKMLKKLFVYAGEKHPHAAQKPEILDLANFK